MIDRQTLSRTWRLLRPGQRRSAGLLVVLMLVAALASAGMVASIFPFLSLLSDPDWADRSTGIARIRSLTGLDSDYAFVVASGTLSILLIVLGSTLLMVRNYALVRFNQFLAFDLARQLLARYLGQPYVFALDRHSGDLSTNVLSEAQQVVGGFVRPLMQTCANVTMLLALTGSVIALQPVAGAAAFGLVGAFYGLLLLVTRTRVRRYGQRRAAVNQQRFKIAAEAFGGFKDIKLLGIERAYVERYATPARELARLSARMEIIGSMPRFLVQASVYSGIILICLVLVRPDTVGTPAALGGLLPTLGLLALGAQRAMPEMASLYAALTQMRFGAAAVDRIWADFDATAHVALTPPGPPPAPLRLKRALELDRVSFAYPNAERPGLSEVSTTIRAGERIGIVGATGAGKTTLADLLLGLLAPQAGRLRVDGVEIGPESLRAWQRAVSYVPQDIFLTDASVAENIALGVPPDRIDTARLERSARLARLHEFVTNELAEGYRTPTGERGVRLSGGQRQRVGIARALYHDADLIVLDEATSALDGVTERDVMSAIAGLPGETTVVMIAHRLSTLRNCDRLLLLDQGRLVAEGPWAALLDNSAAFRDFARHAGVERLDATG